MCGFCICLHAFRFMFSFRSGAARVPLGHRAGASGRAGALSSGATSALAQQGRPRRWWPSRPAAMATSEECGQLGDLLARASPDGQVRTARVRPPALVRPAHPVSLCLVYLPSLHLMRCPRNAVSPAVVEGRRTSRWLQESVGAMATSTDKAKQECNAPSPDLTELSPKLVEVGLDSVVTNHAGRSQLKCLAKLGPAFA